MSKESIKARELKRIRAVEKYAEKRKELKEAGDYDALQSFLEMQILAALETVAN